VRARTRDDAGESLVESLVSLAIIGIAVTGLTAGFGILGAARTAQDGAVTHAAAAQVQGVLRSWAQTLSRPADTGSGYVYTPCASASSFPQPAALLSGWSASVDSVQYWSGTGWTATCGTDQGLQRVRLSVTSAGATYSASTQKLDVVVRRPCKDVAC
jgi:type II secretory pathway pseudopilin PulG